MGVLGGWAFFYGRGTPVSGLNASYAPSGIKLLLLCEDRVRDGPASGGEGLQGW